MRDGVICIIGIIFFVYVSRIIGRLVDDARRRRRPQKNDY